MESTTESEKISSVIRRTELKEKKGLFSSKKENLIIGDKVVILEEDGNYKKVRTPLGNIGYIKENKLSDEVIIRENVVQNKKKLNVLRNYSNISGIYDGVKVDEDGYVFNNTIIFGGRH